MLTEAEREKVFYTRGFRNFCFRADKANPHILSLQLRRVLYYCILDCILGLLAFSIGLFNIDWFVKIFVCAGVVSV